MKANIEVFNSEVIFYDNLLDKNGEPLNLHCIVKIKGFPCHAPDDKWPDFIPSGMYQVDTKWLFRDTAYMRLVKLPIFGIDDATIHLELTNLNNPNIEVLQVYLKGL